MKDRNIETTELRWILITASLASIIGMVGLLAIMSQGAWADQPGGFKPGNRTFSNPFANQGANTPPPSQAQRPQFFDDEDSEEITDFGASAPGDNAGAVSGSNPTSRQNPGGSSTVSGGGTPPSGVIQGKSAPSSLDINSETGEGSKEIITDFNFPDADILDIAKTLGKLTGKNFILDKDVKGRITIISNSSITVADAWKAFLTALDINGFALIPSGKYIRIARQRDARDKQLKTYTGGFSPDTDALITRVFPLKYIDAEEVARTFRSFMPANSRIIPYEQTNTVIVTDTGSNIAKLNKMLELLDVEGYDVGIEVIPIKYASATELSKLIDTLIPGTGPGPGAPGGPRFGGGGGSRFNARRTKEGGVINTIISDERTNTLIVNANGKGIEQVRALIGKLDRKLPPQVGGGKVHVVYLQFADAEATASTLNNISSGTSTGGFRPATGAGGTGINPVATSLFEGSLKIAPDKATNSLVITASPTDFATIQRVINRLDIPRDEVYVEVVVMEIGLSKNFNYSSNVASPLKGVMLTPNQDLMGFLTNPIGQTGAIIGYRGTEATPLLIGGVTYQIPNVAALIKAIQSNSRSNILATPQIIALDNSEANFESSENIPVPTVTQVQGAGVATGITKERVALSIKIKPQINKMSNFVKLDVTTKLGDISDRAVPAEVSTKAFATIERTAQTTVVVGDSDTVVIGGLIRDKINETVSKIPILGDIPLLGWLFRAKSSSTEKTNLLIFMTPHIVRQYEKVRAILDKKLKQRDEFLENEAGGEDPLRGARDEIIRGLPDLERITTKPQTSVTIDEDASAPATKPAGTGNPFTGGMPPASTTTPPAATTPPAVGAPGANNPEMAPDHLPEGDATGTLGSPLEN